MANATPPQITSKVICEGEIVGSNPAVGSNE